MMHMKFVLMGKSGVGTVRAAPKSDGMLAYVRVREDGKLVYLFALSEKESAQMLFDDHGQAWAFAMSIGLDFVHQPWSPDVERRIHEHLGL